MLLSPIYRPDYWNACDLKTFIDASFCVDGYCKPLIAIGCLYFVAISPPMLVVLYAVVKDEHIRFLDLVEIATPRDVAWLQYSNSQQRSVATSTLNVIVSIHIDHFWWYAPIIGTYFVV